MNRYRGKVKLNRIVYMHRMSGSVCKNLDMCNWLCRDRAIEHVRLVTSMWDIKVDKTGVKHRGKQRVGVDE